jgi:ADP-ribose pyrophosphatase YjhB (NUDIX family)
MVKNKKIAIKVLLLIEHKGKLLLNKGQDSVKKETFYRFVGGSVKFGETTEKALRREIREELNSEIENLKFLQVVENIFTYEGEKCHEIIFLYKGDLSNKNIYQQKFIPIPDARGFPAEWVPISDILEGKIILYPTFNHKQLFSKANLC